MRRTALTVVMGIFVAASIGVALWFNITRHRILVLHSYETEYVWVHDIDSVLKRAFGKHSWIDVRYHYMETKKHPGIEQQRRAGIAAVKAIEDIKPDVIVAFDDNAQELAVKRYVNHPKIKIVFAGVNGSIEPYGYDKAKNATGIFERKPVEAVEEVLTILSRNPENRIGRDGMPVRALFLGDKSSSVRHDAAYLASHKWVSVRYLGVETVDTFEAWKAAIKGMSERTDVVLVGGYRGLRLPPGADGKPVYARANDVMAWTEANSPVPVIGMNVFNTQDGAMLSVGVSPFEQASVAAGMALKILEKNESPNAIPIRTSRLYVVSMREKALKRRRIRVPGVFEAFARATDNFIEDRPNVQVSAQ